MLDALGDPTRRRIIDLLGERPYRPGELTGRLGTSAPAMSRHLRVLLESGLVTDERPADDARGRIFRLRPEAFAALVAWADQMNAHWRDQLGSFKDHVERTTNRSR